MTDAKPTPPTGDEWGSRESDAGDPNYGRVCLCGAPIRAGERYAHSCPRLSIGPAGADPERIRAEKDSRD